MLPRKCMIAKREVVNWVKPKPAIKGDDNTPLSLDCGDSPNNSDYKQHLEKRISQETGATFSRRDLDVGHIKEVA